MMRGIVVFCGALIFFTMPASAQSEFKKLKEFRTSTVRSITLDRLGDIYLSLANDSIRKLDTEGNFMTGFSDPEKLPTTILEPWNPLKIFRYNAPKQEITYYDRFFEQQERIAVDPVWAIEPVLAAPGINNNIWVLDKADWRISLVNPKTKGVVREATLKIPAGASPEFVWLREYQSVLFLIDKNSGLMIFNAVGTLVRQIKANNLEYIGFLGEEYYYLHDHKLIFLDLYNDDTHEIPVDPAARFVMVTDERMIVVKTDTVEVREFKVQ